LIILATNNPGKIDMFGQALARLNLRASGLRDAGLSAAPVEENGTTPEENALLKARAAWSPGRIVFADDAGLEIDALGGEPGVRARRWNGLFEDTISDDKWLDYLLRRLEGVPSEKRTAKFVSGWALITGSGLEHVTRIITPFTVEKERIRPMKPGFPLSAVARHWDESTHDDIERCVELFRAWDAFREITMKR